jgi:hypothetical protein
MEGNSARPEFDPEAYLQSTNVQSLIETTLPGK